MIVSEPKASASSNVIDPQPGALTDKFGKKTYLPVVDVEGKQWSMQYIQENGAKRFAKNSRKEGCFHAVGGLDALATAPALVISEGYATAATLKQSLGFATVSAFDSGNLAPVATALHKKFPDKPVVIAGDDDRHLEIVQGVNPGRTKAEEAAALARGKLLLPIFSQQENTFPSSIGKITPDMYRAHQAGGNTLDDEQIATLAHIKNFTDFNDLATKIVVGREGVDRQIRPIIEELINSYRKMKNQTLEIEHAQNRRPAQGRIAKVA